MTTTLSEPGVEGFLAHYDELMRYLARRVGCWQTAADLAQEVFLRLLHAPPERVERPRAMLFRMGRNLAVDRSRRDRCWEEQVAPCVGGPGAEPCPQAVAEHRERLERVRRIVESLPPKQREVFILHRFGNLTYAEIAERAGISVSTVEKHVIRALATCREELAEEAPA